MEYAALARELMDMSNGLTYSVLREQHVKRLQAQNKSSRVIANHLSAFKAFQQIVHATDADIVRSELGDTFPEQLKFFETESKRRGAAPSTINTRKSQIRDLKDTYDLIVHAVTLPSGFREALDLLMKRQDVKVSQLALETNICMTTLWHWTTGIRTPTRSLELVARLEQYFHLEPGELVYRIRGRKLTRRRQTGLTTYGRKIQELMELEYGLKVFPPQLAAEFDDLVKYKTAELPPLGLYREKKWKVRRDGSCGAAEAFETHLRHFAGYLTLPPTSPDPRLRGKGLQAEDLTLGMLGIPEYVLGYAEFRKQRSEVFTKELINILSSSTTLLKEEVGYLRQQPQFGSRLSPPVVHDQWDRWCNDSCKQLQRIQRTARRDKIFQRGRNVREPIADILDLRYPIEKLFELADVIEEDLPANRHRWAVSFRDLVLVRLLIANPLRIRMYAMMTYIPGDRESNLYRISASRWGMRFKAEDFKNDQGAAQEDYEVVLAESITPYLERYVNEARPLLADEDLGKCKWFFRPSPMYARRRVQQPMCSASLSRIIAELTQACLPNCPGFGPHAFRHIIATDYIKNRPNGYDIAAKILHDTVETVRREYAHVKTADHFRYWTDYHEERLRQWHGDVVLLSATEREELDRVIKAMPGNSQQEKIQALHRYLDHMN